MLLFRVFLLGFLVSFITACSDGSDNAGSGGGGPAALTGQFVDSPVAGVGYATESGSGVTNADGQFQYLEGETVRFSIGDLVLGEARGATIVSVFDLVDGVVPVVGEALRKGIADAGGGPSLSTVINLATLLQTIDSDGNPENGIEIAPDVAALFAANSIDFNKNWREFIYDQGFAQALAEARARTLLDAERQARKPWLVMAHLYGTLGIDSELQVAGGENRDSDGDGTPDVISSYAFDTEGKLVRRTVDYNRDGTPDEITVYTYDSAGNLVRDAQTYGSGGKPDYVAMYSYDDEGNQIGRTRDLDGDGTIDDTASYRYDASGNRTREESGDGSGAMATRISVDTYDANGNHTRSEQDRNADGKADQVYTFVYDANGNRVRAEQDDDGDGNADAISEAAYDADGNLVREESDRDGDGKTDRVATYAYDADGRLSREEVDSNDDGTPDLIKSFVYDAQGRLSREELDADGDGTPDSVVIITRTYDASANGWWSAFNDSMAG
ncbi:MAG: hypothetical protein KDI33_14550 [Halioglobus sp.]|nr:hypothetical protein [Halioglobus sp.]